MLFCTCDRRKQLNFGFPASGIPVSFSNQEAVTINLLIYHLILSIRLYPIHLSYSIVR